MLPRLINPIPLTPVARKPVESIPSSLSAFRFATFVCELTISGGRELAVVRPSAVADEPVLLFVS